MLQLYLQLKMADCGGMTHDMAKMSLFLAALKQPVSTIYKKEVQNHI
jgi:hypothetical protein